MASSNDGKIKEGGTASLEKVQESAKKLQAAQDNHSVLAEKASAVPKQAGVFKTPSSIPSPTTPMDHAVLENIGLVGKGKNIASSSVASISALSDATKNATKQSVLPKGVENASSGIQVNSDYKPAFQSPEGATLAASMDKPKGSDLSAASSLQSRLKNEQSNIYRAGSQAKSDQPLGGGFRMASDPNTSSNAPSSPSYSTLGNSPVRNEGEQPMVQSSSRQNNGANNVQHHEDVKGKSGMSAGALGMLGVLLVAGGGAAVVMKPDLLSTTGIISSRQNSVVKTVSAPDALIPQASEVYQKPAPMVATRAVEPVQNQRVAAVAVMPAPAKPAIQAKAAPAPVTTPSVEASGDLFSETGKDVALKLNADSLKVKADQYIRIGGMPDGAELSSGVDMGEGNWLIAPDAIKSIKLTTADGYKGTVELYMQKIKDDARTAVGRQKVFKIHIGEKPQQAVVAVPQIQQPATQVAAYTPVIIQPAPAVKPQAAPQPMRATRTIPILPQGISEENDDEGFGAVPMAKNNKFKRPTARRRAVAPARAPRQLREALPVGRVFSKSNYGDTAKPIQQQRIASASPVRSIPQVSPQRAKILLKRGNNLYRLGDLISARSLYGQVAASGDAKAAVAMGRTYDPIYFEKLGVQGFQPEPQRALEWYKKAKTAGSTKAQAKIDNLNYYLSQ